MYYLKKNIKIIIALPIIAVTFIAFNFLINLIITKNCISINILNSIKDLGISHIYECINIQNTKNNIRNFNIRYINFLKAIRMLLLKIKNGEIESLEVLCRGSARYCCIAIRITFL